MSLKWIHYLVGVVTVPKLSETTAEKKQLFPAAEYQYENSIEIVKIKKILEDKASTSSSIIRENLSKVVSESEKIQVCDNQDVCNLTEKFNLALPATASMAVYEMYTNYEEVKHTTVNPTTIDYTTVNNAEDKEASIVSALENLNGGEDQTLIENFAFISANDLE